MVMSRCALHSGHGLGVVLRNAKGVEITDSILYGTHRNGIMVRGSENLVLEGNLIMNNQPRRWDATVKGQDFQAAVDICVGEQVTACKNAILRNNIATGGAGIGFAAPVNVCGE